MPSNPKSYLYPSINAGIMLLIALYWLSLPRTFGDEAFFIKWTSLVKKTILNIDQKPPANSVLYINTNGSTSLITGEDPLYKEKTGFYKEAITDRQQLALLLQKITLYCDSVPLVMLNIFFEKPSPNDSLLQQQIDHFPFPLVGCIKYTTSQQIDRGVFNIPNNGAINYFSSDESFLKYPLLLNGHTPSLPLIAYSLTNNIKYKEGFFFPRINGRLSLPNPIIDFKVRPFDINDGSYPQENAFHIRSLSTLLFEWEFWDESDIRQLLNHKTIIIGDFKNDIHSTVFGNMPGPLILHNVYLSLIHQENLISFWWLLFLYLLFWWMSWRIYRQETQRPKKHSRRFTPSTAVGKIIEDSIDDTFFLILGTTTSYFLFNIHINILLLLVYLKTSTYLLKIYLPLTHKH